MNLLYDPATELLRRLYHRRFSSPPVLDPLEHFPGAERFATQSAVLRQEAQQLAEQLQAIPRFHELMPQQTAISDNDGRDWRMFVIKAYGVVIESNARRCPQLAALVAENPDVLMATLSFLAPRKHIPEHCGPFRGVLRYYLGLSVPTGPDGGPGTTLTVDQEPHRIGDGQALLWDDTFPHEVRNDTDQVRIALLLDVRRHGMPLDMELLTRMLIAGAAALVRHKRF